MQKVHSLYTFQKIKKYVVHLSILHGNFFLLFIHLDLPGSINLTTATWHFGNQIYHPQNLGRGFSTADIKSSACYEMTCFWLQAKSSFSAIKCEAWLRFITTTTKKKYWNSFFFFTSVTSGHNLTALFTVYTQRCNQLIKVLCTKLSTFNKFLALLCNRFNEAICIQLAFLQSCGHLSTNIIYQSYAKTSFWFSTMQWYSTAARHMYSLLQSFSMSHRYRIRSAILSRCQNCRRSLSAIVKRASWVIGYSIEVWLSALMGGWPLQSQ